MCEDAPFAGHDSSARLDYAAESVLVVPCHDEDFGTPPEVWRLVPLNFAMAARLTIVRRGALIPRWAAFMLHGDVEIRSSAERAQAKKDAIMSTYKVIGTRPIRHDGVDKVTG